MSETLLIKTLRSTAGLEGEREVTAWPTASPHFVITPYLEDENRFVITHSQSTCKAVGPFKNLRRAQLIAAILGALPFPWDTVYSNVAKEVGDQAALDRFQSEWRKLPEEIRKWQKDVAIACLEGNF